MPLYELLVISTHIKRFVRRALSVHCFLITNSCLFVPTGTCARAGQNNGAQCDEPRGRGPFNKILGN